MIIPAILEKSMPRLKKRLRQAMTFSKKVHVDVMDGVFVPNRTVQRLPGLNLNTTVHLMARNPESYFEGFKNAGVRKVLVHVESTRKLKDVLIRGRKMGFSMGVAINPRTSLRRVFPVASFVDEILVMSVQPGFSGQKFRPSALKRIRMLKKRYPRKKISVDGGIHGHSAHQAAESGADILYASSEIWKKRNFKKAFLALGEECNCMT